MITDAETILVVEDEQKLAQLLREYLQADGFGVHCLHQGDQVASWVATPKPDLMLAQSASWPVLVTLSRVAIHHHLRQHPRG